MKVDRRAYTALVTPFLEDKKIDFKSLENLINIQNLLSLYYANTG